MTPLDLGGDGVPYTGMVKTRASAARMVGAMVLKSSSKLQAFPVLKQVSQA